MEDNVYNFTKAFETNNDQREHNSTIVYGTY